LQDIVNHENSVLQAEMEYAIKTGQQTRASVTARTNIHDISRTKQIVTASLQPYHHHHHHHLQQQQIDTATDRQDRHTE